MTWRVVIPPAGLAGSGVRCYCHADDVARDRHCHAKGRTHPPSYSRAGCLLFVTGSL
jgi:hypothetical protein